MRPRYVAGVGRDSMPVDPQDILECVRVLESLVEDRGALAELDLEERKRLMIAAGRVSQPERNEQRTLSRAVAEKKKKVGRAAADAQLNRTGIRKLRERPVLIMPSDGMRAEAGGGISQLGPGALCSDASTANRSASGASGFADVSAETSAAADERASWDSPPIENARACYVCKADRQRLHFFYDQLCDACGDFNYAKRSQTADLRGRVAYISGARVKIGYQAALMLLRAGARVIVSTRFPRDAARRYACEPDFESFRDRLQIYGLDLRHTPSVEAFARQLIANTDRLDFVIHNACQTVRRPTGFYRHLMDGELGPVSQLPAAVQTLLSDYEALRDTHAALTKGDFAGHGAPGMHAAPELSQVALLAEDLVTGPQLFPTGQLDTDLQQVDLREVNSWRLALHQVSTVELLEVQLVNAIAPFVLNARLKPLLLRTSVRDKHIVNVSAMEGQFYRRFKTDKHPHTNMAKAALNMLTRTSAADYVRDGIHMNSVDTGWITDEDPLHVARRKTEESGFSPPLDVIDGAARIVDPIFDGVNTGKHVWGQFLKDYRSAPW
jgi:NAD(P)-dependent dehydrogenase (short-subunit alcohol dehydrogenase family)